MQYPLKEVKRGIVSLFDHCKHYNSSHHHLVIYGGCVIVPVICSRGNSTQLLSCLYSPITWAHANFKFKQKIALHATRKCLLSQSKKKKSEGTVKVRSYCIAIVLQCWYNNWLLSAASHRSITAYQVKMNLTFMRHCNAVTLQFLCSRV